jgi:uncharacterized protein YecT (DUF1311 family)
MKWIVKAMAIVGLSIGPVHAQNEPIDCTSESLDQRQLDQCAGRGFNDIDGRLDTLYRTMISKYDAPNRALLETAQQRWRAYRDAECAFETNGTTGGTINSMMVTKCRTAKTIARIDELKAQLECEEGDLLCNRPN